MINTGADSVAGIWHDGPSISNYAHKSVSATRTNRTTGFFVPNFIMNSPVFLIDSRSIGFNTPCKVRIVVESGDIAGQKTFVFDGNPLVIDCNESFAGLGLKGSTSFYITFLDISETDSYPLMVHAIMRDSGSQAGDSVHTNSGFTRIRPTGSAGGMVIWSPFIKTNGKKSLVWTYCLHNVFSDDPDPSGIIKIRINTDKGYEFILNLPSVDSGRNYVITASEIDISTSFIKHTNETASIQFESRESRIQGSFFVSSQSGELAGVDHMTGG